MQKLSLAPWWKVYKYKNHIPGMDPTFCYFEQITLNDSEMTTTLPVSWAGKINSGSNVSLFENIRLSAYLRVSGYPVVLEVVFLL